MEYAYDIPSGEPQMFEVDDDEGSRQVHRKRDEDEEPPCHSCPKGGPQNDTLYQLSSRNWDALTLYERLEATFGQYRLPEYLARCEVFAENMRLVKISIDNGIARAQANAYDRGKSKGHD